MGFFSKLSSKNTGKPDEIRANRIADVIEHVLGTLVKAAPDYQNKVMEKFVSRRLELIGHMTEQRWSAAEQRQFGEEGFNAAASALQMANPAWGIEESLQGECLAYLWLESRAGGCKRAETAHRLLDEIAENLAAN